MDDGPMGLPARGETPDLLALTIGAATKDAQTVTPEGKPTARLIDGVTIFHVPTHIDDRGSLVELFDPRWGWHKDPLVSAYSFSVRPGRAKGWAIHKLHEDRYFVLGGEAEVVLYDVRPDSATCGQLSRIRLSQLDRCLMNIPKLVWHGTRNLGSEDFIAVNFPTVLFDHADPDKYRLPIDTPLIPFSFGDAVGW